MRPMEGQVVQVRKQNNYGIEVLYPVNDLAYAVCELASTKTITDRMIYILNTYGCTISLEEAIRGDL